GGGGGLGGGEGGGGRMIFWARSRLPSSTACQASSASLRARRRPFCFCFFGFMRSSFLRAPDRRRGGPGGEGAARGWSAGVEVGTRDRAASRSSARVIRGG